jgi:mannose-6-phosphate isomerase
MEEIIPYEEERPWGKFRQFIKNVPATVKIISVKAGEGTSLQNHAQRSEFWKVISGTIILNIDGVTHNAKVGDEFFVPVGTMHRIEGGEEGGQLLEISLGNFEEDDIIRVEDKYGRV